MQVKSSKADKTQLDVFIQVPYKGIQFVKKDKGLLQVIMLLLRVWMPKRNTLTETDFIERVTVNDYLQTNSKDNFDLSQKSLLFPPEVMSSDV